MSTESKMPQDQEISNENEKLLSRQDRRFFSRGKLFPSARERRREQLLAEWLGEERRPEVFAALRPEPKSISQLINQAVKKMGGQELYLLNQIREQWPQLLGDSNARQCYPTGLQYGILWIEVENPTWLYVFERQQKKLLLEQIRQFSQGKIVDLRFTPRGRNGGRSWQTPQSKS